MSKWGAGIKWGAGTKWGLDLVIAITSPTQVRVTAYTLTGTATTSGALTLLEYRLNGEPLVALPLASTFEAELVLRDGPNTVAVHATDDAAGDVTESVQVTVSRSLAQINGGRIANAIPRWLREFV